MKNLSKVSLVVLSVLVFDAATAAEKNALDSLVALYKSGKLSHWKPVKKEASKAQSKESKVLDGAKEALNKGKEKAKEVFENAKDAVKDAATDAKNKVKEAFSDSDEKESEKKDGLLSTKKSENKADEASTSGASDVEDNVKDLGKKAESEVKEASDKVEDNVKKASDDVKDFAEEAKEDAEDFADEAEDGSDEYYSDSEDEEDAEEKSKPGFFSRLFGKKSGEDDTLAESSGSDDDSDLGSELSETEAEEVQHLLNDEEVNADAD